MFATIKVTPYIFAQGKVVRRLPDGAVAISAAGREFVGAPLVCAPPNAPPPQPAAGASAGA
ncbi:MAG: hypothetical protein EA355_05435 [Rhodobacteraceae bacterium]|nr:MAG: hypothetical protein EA355_05435 [Paracoccaceae bacterium]